MTGAHGIEPHIAAVRHFNRFYTRHIGLLRKTYLGSPYSLGELRVLYEIANAHMPTASEIARALDVDAGYLSRVLRDFEERGLITRKVSAGDARQSHLALTARGRRTFMPVERRTERQVAATLECLRTPDRERLVTAMATIESLLGERAHEPAPPRRNYILRGPRHGDFGWIVQRHAELYAAEYGWVEPFEGLCAQIVADFINNYDPKLERCWIAEVNGENVGSVLLVKDEARVARLRLLLVDPKARGLGLGTHLTRECIAFARAAGYSKMALWTHRVLKTARHIYQQAGFKLVRSERRKSWGQPVVSEHWELDL